MKKKILIIEDDNYLQTLFQEVLVNAGYRTLHSASGLLGFQIASSEKPNLILLDLLLPGGKLNGFDVLKQLKSEPTTKSIPVFIMTNLDSERDRALELGAEEYIIKANISVPDFVDTVNKRLKSAN